MEHGRDNRDPSRRQASRDFLRRFYEENADDLDASLLESAKDHLAERGIHTVEQLREDRKARGFEF